jgi:hypothetical protein
VLRYLAAFGPASVDDIQTWSWLTRLQDVVDELRPRLRAFRDERGRELFDLPEAPRPDPAVPAPVRFLPEYDNLLLSHADRSRVIAGGHGALVFMKGAVLIDGFARAAWRIARARDTATLRIELFGRIAERDTSAVRAEGRRLLAFVVPAVAELAVRFVDPV